MLDKKDVFCYLSLKDFYMKITIIGTGYVGLVNGVCMAYHGADVTCVDIDKEKVDALNSGKPTIYENMLEGMLKFGLQEQRLRFSTDYSSVGDSDITFICVGTPENKDGSANLEYVYSAAREFAKNVEKETVLVVKSTVPVGTTDEVRAIVENIVQKKVHFSFNPEFLKEGLAVVDCLQPDRVVVGVSANDGGFAERVVAEELYRRTMKNKKNVIVTDIRSAEMVKYASNAMLATRISFINEIANLCEAVGANIDDVSKCVGLDSRIGPKFLKAGCGYGGSCFPKDVKALMDTAEKNGQNMLILSAVDAVNEMQKDKPYEKYKEFFKDQSAKKACVLGLAFKPGTDDMREAPSINIIEDLLSEGVEVVACDPVAIPNAKKIFGDRIGYEHDPYKAAIDADVVFIITEWEGYGNLDMNVLRKVMRGDVFIDGRGLYTREDMDKIFKFDRIG